MTADEQALALRPAGDDDYEFLERVYASTRAEELAPVPWPDEQKRMFLAQQFAAQGAHYAEHYPDASFDVVLVDGEPAGRLIVARRKGAILVIDISLLPEHRSRGIGTRLLRPILDGASRLGATVTVHVERFNRARTLYERLGFAPVAEDGVYLKLERRPGGRSAEDGLVGGTPLVARDGNDEDLDGPDRVVLDPVDALGQDGIQGAAEDEAERRARAGGILRGGARVVQARLEQLKVEPGVVDVKDEGLAHGRSEAGRGQLPEHGGDANEAPSGNGFRINQTTGFTRRSLICAGATAGAAVALGVRPRAAAATGPGYLSRSAYAGLEGTHFTVETGARPVVLRLESVSDVAGAASRRTLAGSDDAFALTFSGPLAMPLDSGIHTLRHPSLGSFELFASPVDVPDADRRYEVVVDRSLALAEARAGTEAPARGEAPKRDDAPRAETPEAGTHRGEPEPAEAVVRRASLRRAGRWARCEIVLRGSVTAERVRCRLLRNGKLVAKAARDVSDQRAVMRLESSRPLPSGTYTLLVTAIDADGVATSQRKRVTLR